jgi:hypothetical protein
VDGESKGRVIPLHSLSLRASRFLFFVQLTALKCYYFKVGPLSIIAVVSVLIVISKHEQRKTVRWSRDTFLLRNLIACSPIIIFAKSRTAVCNDITVPLAQTILLNVQLREYTCFAVMLILPLISRAVLQTFRCAVYDEDDPDPNVEIKKLLFVDPAVRGGWQAPVHVRPTGLNDANILMFVLIQVDCGSTMYKGMHAYAVLMTIIWPVGIPIALVIWLSRLSPYLDPRDMSEEEAIEQRKTDPHIVGSSIAFVALTHRPRYWYYEVVFNLQRRLILTCVVLVFHNKGAFICFVLGVSILTTVSEREMNPHLDPFVGAFVYLMQWQILLCILAMLLMDADMTNEVGDVVVGCVLMLVNICMALVVFLDTRGDVVREAREKAVMRAKMVRKSAFRRMTARVSLSSAFFTGTTQDEERMNNAENPLFSHSLPSDDDDDDDDEARPAVGSRKTARVSLSSILFNRPGAEKDKDQDKEGEDISRGTTENPMSRAWKRPISGGAREAKNDLRSLEDGEELSVEMAVANTKNPMSRAWGRAVSGGAREAKDDMISSEDGEELTVEMVVTNTAEAKEGLKRAEASSLPFEDAAIDQAFAEPDVERSNAGEAKDPHGAIDIRSEDLDIGGFEEIHGGAEYTGRLEGPTVVDDEVERVEDIAVPADQISRVVEVEIERSDDEEGGDVIDEVDNEEEGSEQSLADASELAVGIGGNRVASQDHNEASSMKEGSDDDAEVGLDRVCDASEDDAAEDNEMFLAATNALHDAIDVGTLTEEDAHAIIDSATGDDGHVNVSMLTGIVDELQHGESQYEDEKEAHDSTDESLESI